MISKGLKLVACLCLVSAIGLLSNCTPSPGKIRFKVDKPEYPTDHPLTSTERKKITDDFLKSRKVPVLASLSEVEDHTNTRFRSDIDVARRCVILYGLIYVAHGAKTAEYMVDYFKKNHLWGSVSPDEQKYLLGKRTEKQDNEMTWRIENLNVLLWSLGNFKILPLPNVRCSFTHYENLPDLDGNPLNWIQDAKLRNTEDILNEADLIYRIHWATTDARLNKTPMPYHMDNDVVYERHYALNWLTMYADEWDEITTDT
jgi:hypothetical protein